MPHARMPLAAGLVAAALTVAPATVALGASAADAAGHPHQVTHRDARHDMLAFTGASTATPPAPDRTQGDVRRITTTYAAHAVRIKVGFAALARPAKDLQIFAVRLKAAGGLTRQFSLGTYKDTPQGDLAFDNGPTPRGCRIGHHIDYTAHTLALAIPLTCVKRASWVRAGFAYADLDDASALFASPDGSGATGHGDDAYRNGRIGEDVVLGPRVYR